MGILNEGYIYSSYGKIDYLKYVFASIHSLRRYDSKRKVALYCSEEQKTFIEENRLSSHFDVLEILDVPFRSITGFKHNLHLFCPFERNVFLDSDILFLKNPDNLWGLFKPFRYTVTGAPIADSFFGAPKNIKFLFDIIFQKRSKTLKKFNITQLSRVQSGIIYVCDVEIAEQVNSRAKYFLLNKSATHFQSRFLEKGRTEESCEWSLAMSLAELNMAVFPWYWSENSPQLDFIDDYTEFDKNFEEVRCKFYFNSFIYSFRGLQSTGVRNLLLKICSIIPGNNDYAWVKPYTLHFGWFHQKKPFIQFSESIWKELIHKE